MTSHGCHGPVTELRRGARVHSLSLPFRFFLACYGPVTATGDAAAREEARRGEEAPPKRACQTKERRTHRLLPRTRCNSVNYTPQKLEKLREEPSTLGEGSAITLVDVPAKHPIRRIRVGRGSTRQHFQASGLGGVDRSCSSKWMTSTLSVRDELSSSRSDYRWGLQVLSIATSAHPYRRIPLPGVPGASVSRRLGSQKPIALFRKSECRAL